MDQFKGIRDKNISRFTQFDIVDFYPSKPRPLLLKAQDFVSHYVTVDASEIEVILHARKSQLFHEGAIWVKKGDNPLFDVPMGAFDGTEIYTLVGIYILHNLRSDLPLLNAGLYRDDDLIFTHNLNGHELDKLRKILIDFFHNMGLRITIDSNINRTDF